MIDWHSHILPKIDDGSHDVSESLAMLGALEAQGVDTVIATPHFYANDGTVDSFLEKREKAYSALVDSVTEDMPRILLGAEVRYYPGISRMSELEKLRIGTTKLLLLEMPVSKWSEYTVRELVELSGANGLSVIIAHMERYLPLQSRDARDRIFDSGIFMQANSSFFTDFWTRRKALSSLERGRIHFVGSDCHNMKSRPPKIAKAREIIRKKLGDGFVSQMDEYGYSVLAQNSNIK